MKKNSKVGENCWVGEMVWQLWKQREKHYDDHCFWCHPVELTATGGTLWNSLFLVPPCVTHCHWLYMTHRWHWLSYVHSWRLCYSAELIKH